jgi:hypothetical protein
MKPFSKTMKSASIRSPYKERPWRDLRRSIGQNGLPRNSKNMKTQSQSIALRSALYCLVAMAVVQPASATTELTTVDNVFTGTSPTSPPNTNTIEMAAHSDSLPVMVSVMSSASDPSASASVGGLASFGVLRADSLANTSPGALSRADLTVSWTDTYGILSPSVQPGLTLIKRVNIRLSGIGSAVEGPGWGAAGIMTSGVFFSINESSTSGVDGSYSGVWSSVDGGGPAIFTPNGDMSMSSTLDGVDVILTFDILFPANIPFTETVNMTTFARGIASGVQQGVGAGDGSAEADFGTTLQWMGISSVTLMDGTPVTDYTVMSESGVDWSQAVLVPEPSATVLAGLGLVVVEALRRFRR